MEMNLAPWALCPRLISWRTVNSSDVKYFCDSPNGRIYLPLDRFFPSSKLCSSCGHLLDELPLSVREWDCPGCGAHHDRDINAAINIKKAGQYLLTWLKATGSGARKVTPRRNERRRWSVGIPRHSAKRLAAGECQSVAGL